MVRAVATGAQGPQGPGLRVRLMLPAAELRQHGVSLVPLPVMSAEEADTIRTGSTAARVRTTLASRRRFRRALHDAGAIDVAVVQRQVDPLPGRRLDRLVVDGRALVLDVDDAVWLPEPGAHPIARFRRSAEKLAWLAGRADQVIAGNDYLAEWLSGHARSVAVVPSLVDCDRVATRTHTAAETLMLGWIGSPSTARYLASTAPALARFADAHPEIQVKLLVVGGPAPAVEGVEVIGKPWSEAAETAALSRIDVGLMPLPDDPWTRGKCAYKALQYMSAAVPVLADDVGLTGVVVGDGSAGILARSPGDWVDGLAQLSASPELRQSMGDTGRLRVEREYSVRAWGSTLAALIAGAA